MDNKLIKIKERKIKLFKMLDIFLRCVLTLVGSVSLVSMLMFLNNMFGVSYISCLIISLIVPSIYSYAVNTSLKKIDDKIRNMEFDLVKLIDECDNDNELIKDFVVKDVEIRFDGFSNNKKMELLMYIKDQLCFDLSSGYINKIQNEDLLSLMDLHLIKDNDSVCGDFVIDNENSKNYTKSKKKREL